MSVRSAKQESQQELSKTDDASRSCLRKISSKIVNTLEAAFYWYGGHVASHPYIYIAACLTVTALCGVGFLNFYYELRPEKLWIPQDSDYVIAVEWQAANFPDNQRTELALFEADNVLTPTVIQEMHRVYREVADITVVDGNGNTLSQTDLCFKVPLQGGQGAGGFRSETDYCGLPEACFELGILDIWGDDLDTIMALTQEDIIYDVNTATISATYSYPTNFTELLGGVERNSSGHIVGAGAALHQWVMQVNRTEATAESAVDDNLFNWEGEFLAVLQNTTGRPDGVTVYVSSARSYSEVSGDTIVGDVAFLAVGIMLLLAYVTVMLGKFNWVEQRPILSLLGVLSTGMAVVVSFGLCSAFNLFYGPVHSILPLLLIGLGVDDMFVIVQCWGNLPEENRLNLLMKEQMARTMQHGGVAITVTSLTDVLAFAIGASTSLPALQSFCIYAAVGIIALYILQSTFFVACFSLDLRRMLDNRNGLVWCYKHKNYTPNECSQTDLCQTFFDKIFAKYLLTVYGKVCTVLVTLTMLGVSIWGVTNLRQEFDPIWFIPPSSYLFEFATETEYYFPSQGATGNVYLGALDYPSELPAINSMTVELRADPNIATVDSWYQEMVDYASSTFGWEIQGQPLNDTAFASLLGSFLSSPLGLRYQTSFNFASDFLCNSSAPQILASKIAYTHTPLDGRNEQIEAMDRVKDIVNSAGFSDFAAPISSSYSDWETDKVIGTELIRNMSLALVAVLLMTLLLIANILTSFYVFLCVLITLVEVMAIMAWWDLTIDTVSCINLVLCIGLCVDYSAHIGLHFMQVSGSRNERVHKTLREMAPPVLNGAFSTLLSFILLAFSESHVFISFFKIFFGVFIFGVFQGLVLLPVVLSLIGPASYEP